MEVTEIKMKQKTKVFSILGPSILDTAIHVSQDLKQSFALNFVASVEFSWHRIIGCMFHVWGPAVN